MTRYGMLSTYPPTKCGLATFTQSLERALTERGGDTAVIVRALDGPLGLAAGRRSEIADAELIPGDAASMRRAAAALDGCDVAIVQHEYGIYGGRDGDEVVTLLGMLGVPVIVVLHTVLPAPSPHQRTVLEDVCARAQSVVVMTRSARDVLLATYRVAPDKVVVIPHGVAALHTPGGVRSHAAKRRVLTWGLISRGKGIEWGIRAMDRLRHLDVEYVVAGQTHPKVRAAEGEAYREHLGAVIRELGLEHRVALDGRYLDASELDGLVGTADVVLLPYESTEQATSGVLAEAVAAGIPVVATDFPHARELLSGGAGIIAAHGDPASIAEAVGTILESDAAAQRMRRAAARDASGSSWPVVADGYRRLVKSAMSTRAA
ncbi:glycosyltransferase [Microbacterium sp. SS28]|uniref:glycosyltransferase n=1 Tax=Microbacterium sp. SS28 TaxID=2919948 RepID=UPI001FAA09DB|nr:glycosyltransferase [Microbacterium sp. SS28]